MPQPEWTDVFHNDREAGTADRNPGEPRLCDKPAHKAATPEPAPDPFAPLANPCEGCSGPDFPQYDFCGTCSEPNRTK